MTGASDGGLIRWNGSVAAKPIKKHTDALWCIEKKQDGSFVTGANDGLIVMWNAQFKPQN